MKVSTMIRQMFVNVDLSSWYRGMGLPRWCSSKELTCECRRLLIRDAGLISGIGKILWKRRWQSMSVFFPGKFHGQRSLVALSQWDCKESNMTELLRPQACIKAKANVFMPSWKHIVIVLWICLGCADKVPHLRCEGLDNQRWLNAETEQFVSPG